MSLPLSSSLLHCLWYFLHLSLSFLLLSLSLSSVVSQTVQQNCYSQVIILFVRLHSAVNPLGIPQYSLLTLLQSSFSCQSQNIAEGEKRNRDKDNGRGKGGERGTKTWGQRNRIKKYQWNSEVERVRVTIRGRKRGKMRRKMKKLKWIRDTEKREPFEANRGYRANKRQKKRSEAHFFWLLWKQLENEITLPFCFPYFCDGDKTKHAGNTNISY